MSRFKCLFLLVFTSPVSSLTAQKLMKRCSIDGDLGRIAPYVSKVYLQYRDASDFIMQIDSSEVNDGKYSFHKKIVEPGVAFIQIKVNKQKLLDDSIAVPPIEERVFGPYFLDEGKILVTTKQFPFANSKATGSVANKQSFLLEDELRNLKKMKSHWRDTLRLLHANDRQLADGIKDSLLSVYKKQFAIYLKFLNDKNCGIKAHIIQSAKQEARYVPQDILDDFYSQLNQELKAASYVVEFKKFVDFTVGIDAPGFTGITSEGKEISLSSYKGKYVLLEFWGSWCEPCRKENPLLVEVYNKYKGKNFEIVGIALEEDNNEGKSKWLKAIETDKLPWSNILSKNHKSLQPLDELYRIQSYPSNFLVDPTGKIIGKNLKAKDLETKLLKIL